MSFVQVSDAEWKLGEALAVQRRERLQNGPSYEHLVAGLLRGLNVVKVARERARDVPGYFRAVVTVRVGASALDEFYNSASGYRAQYYRDPDLGTLANRFALDTLLPHLAPLIADLKSRTCPASWVERSLRDRDAKLWPHQGVWLRYARKSDRNLLVARWMARRDDPESKSRKRARRSLLTPADETLLELKGGFLSAAGDPLGTFKPTRSNDLHELGYT